MFLLVLGDNPEDKLGLHKLYILRVFPPTPRPTVKKVMVLLVTHQVSCFLNENKNTESGTVKDGKVTNDV